MPTFNLTCEVTVSAYTVVEADSLDEAIKKSEERGVSLYGNQYSPEDDWIIDDADGMPMNIHEE